MNNITITRRFRKIKSKVFRLLLTKNDFVDKLEKLQQADSSVKPSIKAELVEMFRIVGISCECNREDEYYRNLVENAGLQSFYDIEKRIINIMYRLFEVYPTPEDYMKRIVDRLSSPEDGWQGDTLRLRILKQFIKYGNFMSYKGENGKTTIYNGELYIKSYAKAKAGKTLKDMDEIIANIDDDIFSVLETATQSQRQPSGKYGLIKIADDLAKGRFKTDGATKRDLYYFAMVFNMTYSGDGTAYSEDDTAHNSDSDIEKNLFTDYYTNNLMRFITEAYRDKLNSFELDPSGIGINYKNFAEMIYIYFISKDYTPAEKIKKSHEMIERIIRSSANEAEIQAESYTQYYRSMFTDEILSLSEADFESFISANYDHNTAVEYTDSKGRRKSVSKPALQVNISQKSAFDVYNELIDGLKYTGVDSEECNYGLWFTESKAFERILNSEDENKRNFGKLLEAADRFLTSAGKITNPEKVTRTAIIIAYYYYYNALNSQKNIKKSFVDVWKDYTNAFTGLNSMLEEVHYQPVSERNIFDIAVVFSSYVYLKC